MNYKKKDDIRFEFGKNWQLYLSTLSQRKIESSKESLINLLNTEDLSGKTFLDIGSGSGLFSLSAHMLGAEVMSFDYDKFSVEATRHTKEKYSVSDDFWRVERGDCLDESYVESLGKYDIVYSWGVLHHTGDMYKALENAANCVNSQGILVVAIYNTQLFTPIWRKIKKYYTGSSFIEKKLLTYVYVIYFSMGLFVIDLFKGKNPFNRFNKSVRGMNLFTDVIDWIGGYPFETAKPEEIFEFYKDKGFELVNLSTVGGKMGCNEFVFKKK